MQQHLDDLAALIERYGEKLAPLSDARLDRRPGDGGWSARECVGHLTITAELYEEKLAGLLAADAAKGGTGPRRPTLFARLLLGLLRKQGAKKKRVKAPGVFRPDGSDRTFTVSELIEVHERLRAAGARILEAGLESRTLASPASRLLRLRACDAVEVVVVHGHRHADQALRAAGLPADA